MPYRPPKGDQGSGRRHQEPTATPCWPKEQPPGEDYFLLQLTIDSPDPYWDEGASAIGSWKQVTDAYAAMLAIAAPLQRRLIFALYQGRAAVEAQLAFSLAEEARYRREKKANPNN
jgi:hypothetical protein